MSSKKSSSSGSSSSTGSRSSGGSARSSSKTAKPAASSTRPRIRATHADGSPTAAPAAKRSTKSKKPLSPAELEKRRAHAKASVRALGGARTTTPKRALPPPSKRDLPISKRTRSVPPPQDRSEGSGPSSASKELALALAAAGLDKKAVGIEVIDVSGRVDYADFLVIMTGTSDRHVHAIAMGLEEALKQKKILPLSVEGLGTATWVLMDFADVVVHVFQEDTRSMYNIEGMWMDASRLDVSKLDTPNPADAAGGRAPN